MRHDTLHDSDRDRAALYALGALPADESARFEKHLAECDLCSAEVARLVPAASALGRLAPLAEPPSDLESRLMERIRSPRYRLVRRDGAEWSDAGFPGVSIRQLNVDEAAGRQTILVKMRAGATFPVHRHAGAEECYVVEGQIRDGDLVLTAGDYIRFPEGTAHGPIETETGCLLLVQSSLDDDVEEQHPG